MTIMKTETTKQVYDAARQENTDEITLFSSDTGMTEHREYFHSEYAIIGTNKPFISTEVSWDINEKSGWDGTADKDSKTMKNKTTKYFLVTN